MNNLLSIDSVSKHYGDFTALNKVSINIKEGSIFGLLGPNGAGKTTLIRIINQITHPDEGKILFNNEPLNIKHIRDIGYLPEERGLYPKMNIGDQAVYLDQLKGLDRATAKAELRKWFDKFDCVIGDEAHLFKAKSLTSLMGKLHDCKYRIGFTGTLDGANVNQLVLEGVFGKCSKVTKTNELMKQGYLSKLKVKIILIKHKDKIFEGYQNEMDYLVEHEPRNKFIKNLAKDLKGNTLILFNYVEKHGLPLFNMINSDTERPVYFVHGGVDTEDREEIRQLTEKSDNSIIVASYGTFSTGINIRNLHNVIFASPSKSRIRNLQSIGRVLRKGDNKSKATLYDIADDISTNKGNNYTLNHLLERVKIYNEEKFDYEIIDVKLKDD